MSNSFIIRNAERGHDMIKSDGSRASYIAGHPDGFVTRASSFNFNQYQSGRPGFGPVRVFGDEIFHGAGCGYNMHPHHNFVICAFIFEGELTHINTAGGGMVDRQRHSRALADPDARTNPVPERPRSLRGTPGLLTCAASRGTQKPENPLHEAGAPADTGRGT